MSKEPKLPAGEEAVPNEPTVAQLMAMLIEMRKGDQDIQNRSLKQTASKNNARAPEISVYNPQGQKDYPMPVLQCEVLMPWPLRASDMNGGLTYEEVELMNKIKPGEYVLELLDGTAVQCCVLGTKNTITGKIERLAFMGQFDAEARNYSTLFSKERRNIMPSMVSTLKQVIDQMPDASYEDVLSMKERTRRTHLPADDPKHLPVSVGE